MQVAGAGSRRVSKESRTQVLAIRSDVITSQIRLSQVKYCECEQFSFLVFSRLYCLMNLYIWSLGVKYRVACSDSWPCSSGAYRI